MREAGFRGGGPFEGYVEGVSIDTRTGCSRALFVALEGANADGHDFLAEAVEGGAAALLVSRKRRAGALDAAAGVPVFDVPDTIAGLQAIASCYRDRVDPKVVAVTGSNGKTGTKDFIASMLASRFTVHATPGNLNNHIGLPLTLLGMEGAEEILVTEMGANHRNEIKCLAGIARPAVGVITNIGPGHLEFFGSLKGVAAAKAELVEALPRDGTAVLPADDDFLPFLKARTKAGVVTFGFSEGSDWRVEDVTRRNGGGYRFKVGGREMDMSMYGRHNLLNAAAAAAASSLFGISPDDIAGAVARSRSTDGRGALHELDGIVFMDDSYNCNPLSLRMSVDTFMEIPVSGRKWLVMGDMLELGGSSAGLHREAGIYCGRAGFDGILTLGAETVELNRSAAEQRKAPRDISHFIDHEKLASYLNTLLRGGDGVLLKGSRGMRMERIIAEVERLRGASRRRMD